MAKLQTADAGLAVHRTGMACRLDAGFEVPVMGSWNEPDDTKVARISPAAIREAVLELGGGDKTDAVFLACTSLRLARYDEPLPDRGTLFTRLS